MVFRSAVDGWFYAIIAVAAVVVAGAMLPLVQTGDPLKLAFAAAVLIVSIGLPVWILVSTRYEVRDGELAVQSGPFRLRIAVSDILQVKRSRSALSSPALSLDRIEITYGRGKRILLSPADRQGFLRSIGKTLD